MAVLRSSKTDTAQLPATSYAVLGLLGICGEASGYFLKQFADQSISHFYWSPAKSQIYSELRRLQSKGFVTVREVEQVTRPDKREYAITATGRAALKSWIEDAPEEQEVSKSPLLLKVFFGGSTDPLLLAEKLRRYADGARAGREQYAGIKAQFEGDDQYFYARLTLDMGLMHCEAGIEWAARAIAALEAKAAPRAGR